MARVARSRLGILGILFIGVVIGYGIARTNTPFVDAQGADKKNADKDAESAKATPTSSPVKATRARDRMCWRKSMTTLTSASAATKKFRNS